jgi:DNA-binding transcriptional MocR family regulator
MRTMSKLGDGEAYLYESLANLLAKAIAAGTLKAGDRMPSVRKLRRQYDVSTATAVQAYRLLENRRLIDARPKSGFFVAGRLPLLPEPAQSRPPSAPRYVVTPSLLREYLEALESKDAVSVSAVLPHPETYPAARLARLLSARVRRQPELTASYPVSKGSEELRRVIARRALEVGVKLSVDDILITDGCMEALSLCLRAAARPGDVIALESPTYFLFLHAIESLGMKALEVPTHPRTGISIEALDLATQKRGAVKALVLGPTYSNPLGAVMPDENKARAVALCAERGIALIEDDVFGDTCFGAKRPLPAKAWDRSGNVMLCSSFSKTLAPGLRVGWVAPGRWMKDVETNKIATTIFTPMLPQLVIAEFVADGGYDHHLRKLRAALAERARRFNEAVVESFPDGCRVTRPTGGYNVWVELPPKVDSVALFRRAAREGIVVSPGPLFTTTKRFRNFIRMSYSQPWSRKTEAAVATVGQFVRQLAGR